MAPNKLKLAYMVTVEEEIVKCVNLVNNDIRKTTIFC